MPYFAEHLYDTGLEVVPERILVLEDIVAHLARLVRHAVDLARARVDGALLHALVLGDAPLLTTMHAWRQESFRLEPCETSLLQHSFCAAHTLALGEVAREELLVRLFEASFCSGGRSTWDMSSSTISSEPVGAIAESSRVSTNSARSSASSGPGTGMGTESYFESSMGSGVGRHRGIVEGLHEFGKVFSLLRPGHGHGHGVVL